MKTKFISFYCDRNGGDYYTKCKDELQSRLDEFEANYHIEELPSRENYMLNCLMKPQFILDCIKKLNEPVIWIDIDCKINQLPTELDSIETDIALAIREHDLKTPHSALLFFNNTEKSISFLEEWKELCKGKELEASVGKYTKGDHHQLILLSKNNKTKPTFTLFPPSLCAVESDASKVSIGLSYGDRDMVRENKMQALYPPFSLEHGSSCAKIKPKFFHWTNDEHHIQVFIDNGMMMAPTIQRKENTYRFGWMCESRAVVPELYNALKHTSNLFFEHFDAIFTCDDDLLGLDDRFRFALSGSNLPWTPLNKFGIHEKTKICSLLASPKLMTEGHKMRHKTAEKLKDDIDIFGGVAGSKKVGTDGVASSGHPPKEEAIKDYMFSITIENDVYNNYFTEKITDCFANGTIPVYWGCPNIGQYFNEDGILLLTEDFDINSLTKELYDSKIDAVKENYERICKLKMSDDILWDEVAKIVIQSEMEK